MKDIKQQIIELLQNSTIAEESVICICNQELHRIIKEIENM